MNSTARRNSIHTLPRTNRNTIKALVIGGATALAVAGFAAYGWTTKTQPTDSKHCVVSAVPEQSVYVLLDLTDALSAAQLRRVIGETKRLSDQLRETDRLEILALASPEPKAPAKVLTLFAGCRPRSPDNAGLDRGRRVLERELERGWMQPIQASLEAVSSRQVVPASTSPILATLKEVAMRSVGRQRRLVLVSDLMESEAGNAYKAQGLEFKKLRDARIDAVRVEGMLRDFDVHVFQLIDSKRVHQQAQAQEFFSQYFAAAGARADFSRI